MPEGILPRPAEVGPELVLGGSAVWSPDVDDVEVDDGLDIDDALSSGEGEAQRVT